MKSRLRKRKPLNSICMMGHSTAVVVLYGLKICVLMERMESSLWAQCCSDETLAFKTSSGISHVVSCEFDRII